uniref:C-type lectin domain-containing protein n=1 Tax=Salarias fasciatus TaxID=181472 RepID=A0A672HWZ5_SALFA
SNNGWLYFISTHLALFFSLSFCSLWCAGEPNNHKDSGEECGEIRGCGHDHGWNDEKCSNSNFWICEKKMAL